MGEIFEEGRVSNAISDSERLKRLASYVPVLSDEAKPFFESGQMVGRGTWDEPFEFGSAGPFPAEIGNAFVEIAYATGWVRNDFDWMDWSVTEEGADLRESRVSVLRANQDQLGKLLTSFIKADRLIDGALQDAYSRGMLLAIAERARAFLDEKYSRMGPVAFSNYIFAD